jgi:hypothetical protein
MAVKWLTNTQINEANETNLSFEGLPKLPNEIDTTCFPSISSFKLEM